MKHRRKKHKPTADASSVLELGILNDALSESEKRLYAKLQARRVFQDATGETLPLDCFKVEKDAAGDYLITLDKGGLKNE